MAIEIEFCVTLLASKGGIDSMSNSHGFRLYFLTVAFSIFACLYGLLITVWFWAQFTSRDLIELFLGRQDDLFAFQAVFTVVALGVAWVCKGLAGPITRVKGLVDWLFILLLVFHFTMALMNISQASRIERRGNQYLAHGLTRGGGVHTVTRDQANEMIRSHLKSEIHYCVIWILAIGMNLHRGIRRVEILASAANHTTQIPARD